MHSLTHRNFCLPPPTMRHIQASILLIWSNRLISMPCGWGTLCLGFSIFHYLLLLLLLLSITTTITTVFFLNLVLSRLRGDINNLKISINCQMFFSFFLSFFFLNLAVDETKADGSEISSSIIFCAQFCFIFSLRISNTRLSPHVWSVTALPLKTWILCGLTSWTAQSMNRRNVE